MHHVFHSRSNIFIFIIYIYFLQAKIMCLFLLYFTLDLIQFIHIFIFLLLNIYLFFFHKQIQIHLSFTWMRSYRFGLQSQYESVNALLSKKKTNSNFFILFYIPIFWLVKFLVQHTARNMGFNSSRG